MTGIAIRLLLATLVLGLFIRVIIALELVADPLVEASGLWWAFVIGVYHDLWAYLFVVSPVVLALLVAPRFAGFVLFCVCVLILVVTFAEVFFWWEFASRLNRLVFHYLLFPKEVVVFLEDQFFVSLYALPTAGLAFGVYRLVRGRGALGQVSTGLAAGILLLAVGGMLWVGPWAFSDSRRINEMAANGYLAVLRAARIDESRWHGAYWAPPEARTASQPDRGRPQGRLQGRLQAPLRARGVKHVVLIVEESFGGPVWRDPVLRRRYLPEFSRLMRRGVYFSALYATGSRTTRGLEALLNGFPPLPGIAVTQRPGYQRLPSLPRALADNDFHTIFVYGGWPDFSNFRAYWRSLGYAEQTSRADFPDASFMTSWGVADEDLFERVRQEMRRLTRAHARVFLTALTVSHHRPFDFPPDRIGFPASERRSEYALAYADWALGDFLEKAAAEPWYADTLFVVVADHGPRIYGNGPIPVEGFRVPMAFYAPEHLPPQRIDHLGSTMSLGVTLLDLLGLESAERLYGADLLAHPAGPVPVEHDYHVGLVTPRGLTVLHRGGAVTSWRNAPQGWLKTDQDWEVAAPAASLFGGAHDWWYRGAGLDGFGETSNASIGLHTNP